MLSSVRHASPDLLDLLASIAVERGIDGLAAAIATAKDRRRMDASERATFDAALAAGIEATLAEVTLSAEPTKPGVGDGVNAGRLASLTYQAFCACLDAALWALPTGAKRLVSIDFQFPLSVSRPFAISPVGNDAVREESGQPGWDANANSSTGRQTLWNTYRGQCTQPILPSILLESCLESSRLRRF